MATAKSESEVVIPERFLSAHTPDDYVLVIEDKELHVSKGLLASHSEPLSAMVFNEGFRNAREGTVDLENKKYVTLLISVENISPIFFQHAKSAILARLSDVVPLLCWLYREEEDPKTDGKMYTALGKAKGIAIDDLVGLHALADEWDIRLLQKDCRQVYLDFVSNGFKSKAAAMKALEALKAAELFEGAFVEWKDLTNRLIKASVTVQDILSVALRISVCIILFGNILTREYESKAEAVNALSALGPLWEAYREWEYKREDKLRWDRNLVFYLDRSIKAGVNLHDIHALNVTKDFRLLLLNALVSRFEKQQNESGRCFHCGESKNLTDPVSGETVCACPGAKAQLRLYSLPSTTQLKGIGSMLEDNS